MHGHARFQTTYTALIALAWNALERIDQRLILHKDTAVMAELPLLRLELLQLGMKSKCCAESRLVSASQDALVQRLVARLLAWLDFDPAAPTEVAQMRIRSAQNWLFDEAREGQGIDSQDCDVRRGYAVESPGPS